MQRQFLAAPEQVRIVRHAVGILDYGIECIGGFKGFIGDRARGATLNPRFPAVSEMDGSHIPADTLADEFRMIGEIGSSPVESLQQFDKNGLRGGQAEFAGKQEREQLLQHRIRPICIAGPGFHDNET